MAQKQLDVTTVLQENEYWCWAACVAMARQYFYGSALQCVIVSVFIGEKDSKYCCHSPIPDDCLTGASKDDIQEALKAWGLTGKWSEFFDFGEIKQSIDDGMLCMACISDESDLLHVMIVSGYNDENKQVYINNPDPDDKVNTGWRSYSDLEYGFGIGELRGGWIRIAHS